MAPHVRFTSRNIAHIAVRAYRDGEVCEFFKTPPTPASDVAFLLDPKYAPSPTVGLPPPVIVETLAPSSPSSDAPACRVAPCVVLQHCRDILLGSSSSPTAARSQQRPSLKARYSCTLSLPGALARTHCHHSEVRQTRPPNHSQHCAPQLDGDTTMHIHTSAALCDFPRPHHPVETSRRKKERKSHYWSMILTWEHLEAPYPTQSM